MLHVKAKFLGQTEERTERQREDRMIFVQISENHVI